MLRSKPIAYITALTLLAVAGVAIACKLKHGGPPPVPADAATCAVVCKLVPSADAPSPAEPVAPTEAPPAAPPAPEEKKPDVPASIEAVPVPPALPGLPPPPPHEDKYGKEDTPVVAAPPGVAAAPPEADKKVNPDPVKVNVPPTPPASTVPADAGGAIPPPPPDKAPPAATPPLPAEASAPPAVKPVTPVVEPSAPAPEPTPAVVVAPYSESGDKAAPPAPAPASAPTDPPPAPPADKPSAAPPPPKVEVETPPAPPTKPDAAPTPPPADRAAGWNDPRSPIATIPAAPLLYKVGSGKGESLRDIARRTLGSEDRWAEIDQLNPELRSQLIVPSGKVVKLPPGAKVDLPGGGQSESEFTPKGDLRPVPHLRPKTDAKGKKKSQPMTGSYTGKLDDQRAVAVPGDVWEQLGKHEAVLLTPGPDGCLWLATHSSAARLVERMEKSHHADRDVQAFKRIYYAQSVKAKVVDDGKVIVPDKLAEYAGLGKDVVLIGIDDHFELWDAARWQRYSRAQEPVWRTGGERD